jgi:hypothetical protein
MEPNKEGERTLGQSVAHWRSIGLVAACLAGGLTLTVMVMGSTPTIGSPVAAAIDAAVAEADAADPSTILAVDPATTAVIPESAEVIPESTEVPAEQVQDPLAAPAVIENAAAPVAAPAAPAPAQPAVTPTATPTAVVPSPKPAPAAPVSTAAPTTPAPTTAPPLPTTAAPSPAPALTYPSYTVSGVSAVSLQFDGSSISVASLSPQANWVYEIEKNGPRSVEIKFFNVVTGADREFHATVEGGGVKVET